MHLRQHTRKGGRHHDDPHNERGNTAVLNSWGAAKRGTPYFFNPGKKDFQTVSPTSFGTPAEAVDSRKRKKLTLTAMKYLGENECFKQPRFDVVEVWQQDGKIISYNLIENAFYAEDFGGQYEIF